MSRNHLPAGQNMQGIVGGGPPGVDMANGPGGGGPRRRPPPQYMPQQYHHQPQMNPMYTNYMQYPPQPYYGMPPQFQNGGMPGPAYMNYPNYARSPPNMQQYVPMMGVSAPPNYPRPNQQSPALATPYQPPPAPAPMPSHTPTSSHSSQVIPPPSPATSQSREPPVTTPVATPVVVQQTPSPVTERTPFRPPLPWLSRPDVDFPTRTRSRRPKVPLNADSAAVSLPVEQHEAATVQNETNAQSIRSDTSASDSSGQPASETNPASASTRTQVPSHNASAVTPTQSPASLEQASTPETGSQRRVVAPAVPVVPKPASNIPNGDSQTDAESTSAASHEVEDCAAVDPSAAPAQPSSPPAKLPPSSWAKLFAKPTAARSKADGPVSSVDGQDAVNGTPNHTGNVPGLGFSRANATSLAEAIQDYRVGNNDGISFLEPRGLINTGNMCYMNSVLQVLMFCVPFWDFLDQVSKRAAHSFKSETPLIDAMVMFMNEYKVIKSAASPEHLRRALKHEQLEQYGEPFTPEFVYDAIRQLPRFASMRRGHQQDAEEFLGFLLQSLDDECLHLMNTTAALAASPPAQDSATASEADDWLEVGRKQRSAVTRSSGSNSSSPITRVFGGLLRSEFRVPGLKDSITTEPYQPLQLDIGSPDVRSVVDALRGLTRPERLQGNFNSPRGKDVTATKQVFIETLPPVLILHLKRFQFDPEADGTVKIWKKIGYPLELEIPREALSRQKRQTLGDKGMPKYKLISVVYHHGKNASGGHYTVDVRRQEGDEWIRLDDTVLRRVRSEDVADPSADDEPKDNRKDGVQQRASTNRFDAMNEENQGDDEGGWNKVTTATNGGKRWSNVANGTGSASPKSKQHKDGSKDRVAYILFYQRV